MFHLCANLRGPTRDLGISCMEAARAVPDHSPPSLAGASRGGGSGERIRRAWMVGAAAPAETRAVHVDFIGTGERLAG